MSEERAEYDPTIRIRNGEPVYRLTCSICRADFLGKKGDTQCPCCPDYPVPGTTIPRSMFYSEPTTPRGKAGSSCSLEDIRAISDLCQKHAMTSEVAWDAGMRLMALERALGAALAMIDVEEDREFVMRVARGEITEPV